jgi:hypothetical protein
LATDVLRGSTYRSVALLDCEVCDGVATLSGVVGSFYLKQVAQELVRRVPTIKRVDNRVRVEYAS